MQTSGSLLVSLLEANGVDRVFCVPGESYLALLDALADSKIDTVTARHEGSAGFMALVDGRLTGRPGIFAVSRGPGATNAAIAVHSAQQDGTPLILFIGQVPKKNLGRGSFQEIDYRAMFGSIAKWVEEVTDPERLPETIARAFTVAMHGTPGPVVISLPEDLLDLPAPNTKIHGSSHAICAPDKKSVQQVAGLLRQAQRPLIIAGGEFASDDERALLLQFAEQHQIPVVVGFRRHGVFPIGHSLYAGDLGISTTKEQLKVLEHSDLILALGTRLNEWTTLDYSFPASPWPSQQLVHVCADAEMIGKNIQPKIGMVSRAPDFLRELCDLEPASNDRQSEASKDRQVWINKLAENAIARTAWKKQRFDDGVAFGNVVSALADLLPASTSIVPDAGISAALVYRHFPFGGPRKLYSTISGVMGYGVPASIAVAMREPHRTVVCLVGDGSFMMTGSELAIAVERQLPVRIILSNNRSHGTIRMHQELMYPGRSFATDLPGPNFMKIAEAFGCATFSIRSDDEIAATIEAAISIPGPVLIEVQSSLASIIPN